MHKLLLTALCVVLSLTLISSYALAGTIELETINGMKEIEPFMGDDVLAIKVKNIVDRSSGSPKYSWLPMVEGVIYGPVKDGDALILEIHKDGKPVRSFRVALEPLEVWIDGMGSEYSQNWRLTPDEEDKALTSAGDFTFVFKFMDFATDQKRTLMERKITILKAGTCDISTGKHGWQFAVSSENLLGVNYVFMSPGYGTSAGRVAFYTCMNRQDSYLNNDLKFKITVDGNLLTLPSGFVINAKQIRAVEQVEEMYDYANSQRIVNKYNFYLMKFFTKLYWGPKNDTTSPDWIAMIDHPGKWVVKAYYEGEMFREWRFTVNAQGMIEKHPEQDPSNPGALKFDPFKVFVNTYYPNPENFDEQFDPAAIKAGSFYSRPWISTEVQDMLNALPPAKTDDMPFPTTTLPADKN